MSELCLDNILKAFHFTTDLNINMFTETDSTFVEQDIKLVNILRHLIYAERN